VAQEIIVMEGTLMKPLRIIGTGVLALLLGTIAPTYAQQDQAAKPEKQEQQAKPKKQQEARPAKQEQQQAKGQQQQQQQAKTANQNEQRQAKGQQKQQQQQPKTQQNQEKSQQHQQPGGQQHGQAQGQWARNGQKDSRGHVYSASRFGSEHHARFEESGGRYYNGRREYSFGGYWFYAGAYPAWFYQQDVYFILGADGMWYAVAYGDPSLMFQVDIE
jgi:biopolymer transport protein ExbB/TolQ